MSLFLVAVISETHGQTPDSSVAREPEETAGLRTDGTSQKVKSWSATCALGLNVDFFSEVNAPSSSDLRTLSSTVTADLGLNYSREGARFKMTNELHWLVAVQKAGFDTQIYFRRVNDDLRTLHDFSFAFDSRNRWSVNLITKATTSVFTIFNGDYFSDVNQMGRTKGFLNPYEVTLAPGIKLEPDKYLRISISPYSMRLYGLTSQEIANTGLYTTDVDSAGNYSRFESKRLGAEANIWYDRNIKDRLSLQWRLTFSSDYFEQLGKNGLMEGLFITQLMLFKGLTLSHRALLKGDFAQKPFKPYFSQTVVLSYTKNF
jgi:hypothetical protein